MVGKQGRDDSIKQFSTQLHLHIFMLLEVGLYTELFYAISLPGFPTFAYLLSLRVVTFSMLFNVDYVTV